MNLFQKLTERSWETPTGRDAGAGPAPPMLPTGKIALKFLLAVITVFFFLLILTFLSRSTYPDFQALAGQPWQPLDDAWPLWVNTGVLLLSSVAMQWGVFAARNIKFHRTVIAISLGGFFAIAFLIGQLWVWQQLMALGYYVASNPANSYFYLFTTMHGLHLLGGLVALGGVMLRLWQGAPPDKIAASMTLCATYWHFLFVVWMLLFVLLTSSPETYQTLAALCGFLR